jgi:hypothetical protein
MYSFLNFVEEISETAERTSLKFPNMLEIGAENCWSDLNLFKYCYI